MPPGGAEKQLPNLVIAPWGVVRRNLDFYVEISEATGKNSNKQQKKNSYDKSRYIKKKIISG